MGAYQLVDGVPAHAAVGETVTAVATRAPAARGYVNGVLRAVARAGPPWPWPEGDDVDALGVRYSQPDWMVSMLRRRSSAPETARAVHGRRADTAPAVTLRVNPQPGDARIGRGRARRGAGVRVERGKLLPDALVATGLGDVGALRRRARRQGDAAGSGQPGVARLVAVRVARGRRACSTSPPRRAARRPAIAELAPEGALVVAADLNVVARRADRGSRRERLGLPGVAPVVADGRLPAVAARESFDAVLVDAPCTGLGVLRRRPDARWRVDPADVETLAVAPARAPRGRGRGGAARRGARVRGVHLQRRGDARGRRVGGASTSAGSAVIEPPGAPWRPHGRGALLLPSDADTDGMFVLVLERRRVSCR